MMESSRQQGRLIFYRLFVVSGLLLLTRQALLNPLPGLRKAWGVTSLELFIGGLFLLSLLYLIWLRSGRALGLLAKVQCAVDPFLVTVLLILSGGDDSPLHFLYALAILETAWLSGRRDALMVAGISLMMSMAAILLTGYLFRFVVSEEVLLRVVLLNGAAFGLTALLGGTLAHKARLLQQTLERQQDSLADLASRNQQILEAMPFGLVSVNNQGIIRGVNAAACQILGVEPGRLADRPLTGMFPELAEMAGSPEQAMISREIKRDNLLLGITKTPLTDHRQQQGVGNLFVIQDLTNWRRLHAELAEREKLALTGRMAAFVAHEIRNPLASILSAAQMSRQARDEPQRERLRIIIMEEVARLKQLTTDFLFFARPPLPARVGVALPTLLAEMRESLQRDPTWGAQRILEVSATPNARVLFDPAHLRQIFWNLFTNAAQAAPEGKRVMVAIRRFSPREVLVVVADDGPGIVAAELNKVMEPFHTTRSSGTGLGLSVVSQLMLLNGGSLTLESGGSSLLPDFSASLGGLHVHLFMEAADGQHPDL